MKVVIGCDHGGIELKETLKAAMAAWDVEVEDVGCDDSASVDYPDYAHVVAGAVLSGGADRGVLICGTGIGMSMAANRHPGVRAALCTDCYGAEMTRKHNDANILCLGGRVTGPGLATAILEVFLAGEFEGGRHERRVAKIERSG